ncbi:hypothetical protein MO973_40620 [Paenibacillus sp. TRM 82003]|uniref:hypothetical protein n=1 Tax=Kineococcus sp. TRM81007 TaxID=2925831 RepID=UPI001F56E018|nr:hypothetical protein [Kineococcus sp. TRM81007]MCI3921631.1 hypothetical protein [Paenibacillus sp. TRM 82003]MCI2237388.1 hypothetical protein [Kineococcus sp. TRM81007]MCI2237613.1 hypothetical protein [Kineococcus sp. TRM81007]MCI2240581.1 hypothetical protein [Kineococcus sp. TRM81007]MCI3925497.1 hypothetical protein [Paenibacillus sp. TRM 82003]
MRRLVVDVGLAVLAAAAGAALGLERAGTWDGGPGVVAALVLLTAVLAVVSTVEQAVGRWRAGRRAAHRDVLDDLLHAVLWSVVDATGLDPRELAVAAYRLHRPAWPGRPARLLRLHRVRAGRRPAASGTVWAPGKGVIGRCVAEGEVVAVDVSAAESALGEVDAAGWRRLPAEARQGLTFEEHRRLRGKYGAVVAVPLVDDSGPVSAVVGCLALDGPAGSLPRLTDPVVLGVLEASGRALRRLELPAASAAARAAAQGAPDAGCLVLHAQLQRLDVPAERVRALTGEGVPGS